MLKEIRDLGFEYAELGHGIRISLLPGVYEAVDAGEIKISSLHNFCPLPIGVTHASPNLFQFSSSDPRERENAYRYSLKTIETAARVKAPFVVLHLGSIAMWDYTRKLTEMLTAGQQATPKYEKLCWEASEKREQKKEQPMAWSLEVLERLADQAEVRSLKLGIENREAIEELPLEGDLPFFFKASARPGIGYWHDVGHAQIKENLGFIHHQIHLESLADRLLGFHIHDVEFPSHDHRPPGQGMVDFAALKPSVKPEHAKVLELNPNTPVDQVQAGFDFIKSVWGPD